MIGLQRLEGFYWVARTGGYARAARAFPYPITQPAVHQQVKKLEAELGVTLFERLAKDRVALTAAGRALFDVVGPFYERLPALVRSLRAGEYGGELAIRAAPMFLRQLLPPWIRRVQRRRPEVRIHLQETLAPDVEALRRGDADLLVDHLAEIPDDVATLRVATMRPFVVLPAGHALARRKRLSLAALAEEAFVGYSPGDLGQELQLAALARHGVTPQRMLTASSADAILGFVESGLGYSLVPSLDPSGPRGRGLAVFPLGSPKVEFPVVAAWRKDAPAHPLLDAVLEAAPRA